MKSDEIQGKMIKHLSTERLNYILYNKQKIRNSEKTRFLEADFRAFFF